MAKKKAVKENIKNPIPESCLQDCEVVVTASETDFVDEEFAVLENSDLESGQTSDQNTTSVDVTALPDDYKWEEKVQSIDDFFTYNDYLYLIAEGERQFREFCECSEEDCECCTRYSSQFHRVYKRHDFDLCFRFEGFFDYLSFDDLLFDDPHLLITCHYPGYWKSLGEYPTLSDLKNATFEEFRNALLDGCRLYDFSDFSRVPKDVSDTFVSTCESIDKKKAEIEDNFVLIALYLSDLSNMSDVNFRSYGCKNIYDFAEARFGFGRTTTKNFIAISNKFIEYSVIKEPYRDYSYSQLTELVPVDEKFLSEFNPKMTIKQIRAKKKELLGTVEKVGVDDRSVKYDSEIKNDSSATIDVELLREVFCNWQDEQYEDLEDTQSIFANGYKQAQTDLFFLLKEKFSIDFRS